MNLLDDAYESKHRKNLAQLEGRVERILNELARQLADPLRRWEAGTKTAIPSIRREVEEALSGARADVQTLIENSITNAWNLSNDKNDRLVDSYLKGVTADSAVVSSMHQLNLGVLDSFLRRSERGMNLSKRVWGITKGFEEQMELYVGSGITSGQNAAAIARDIRKLLKNPDAVVRRIKNEAGKLVMTQATRDYHPGPGVYRSSFKNALRLARTETNIAYRLADSERRAQIPFILGVEVHLSNAHPRPDICDSMAGQYPKGFVFTGWHSSCLCYATSILAPKEQFHAYLRDGTPIPKAGFIRNIPEKATQYLSANSDKLKKSGLYWIDDNFTKSWSLKRETLGYEKRRAGKAAGAKITAPALPQSVVDKIAENNRDIVYDDLIKSGVSEKEIRAVESAYKKALDKEDVFIRIDDTNFEKVVSDGRFKTQFETSASGGYFNTNERSRLERWQYGYAKDMDPQNRPVYGFMGNRNRLFSDGTDKADAAFKNTEHYGNIVVKMRSDIRARSTVTYTDSYAETCVPTLLSDPKISSFVQDTEHASHKYYFQKMPKNPQSTAKIIDKLDSPYVEVQMHGGVRLEDIAEIIMQDGAKDLSGETLAVLKKYGIKITDGRGVWR